MQRAVKLSVAALSVLAALAFLPALADAQPRLLESTPKEGAKLGRPPQVMLLCFNEPIAAATPNDYSLTLARAGGATVPVTATPVRGNTCLEARANWPEDATGSYVLSWRVRQQQGGQALSGTLSFSIAPPSPPDVLRLALITIAAVGGAALLALVLTLFRHSIGFEPHRPPAETESESLVGHH